MEILMSKDKFLNSDYKPDENTKQENLVGFLLKSKMYLILTILVQVDLQFYLLLKQSGLFVLMILKLEHNLF